eukprot:jgi/Chlat1/614/Chrsp103S00959
MHIAVASRLQPEESSSNSGERSTLALGFVSPPNGSALEQQLAETSAKLDVSEQELARLKKNALAVQTCDTENKEIEKLRAELEAQKAADTKLSDVQRKDIERLGVELEAQKAANGKLGDDQKEVEALRAEVEAQKVLTDNFSKELSEGKKAYDVVAQQLQEQQAANANIKRELDELKQSKTVPTTTYPLFNQTTAVSTPAKTLELLKPLYAMLVSLQRDLAQAWQIEKLHRGPLVEATFEFAPLFDKIYLINEQARQKGVAPEVLEPGLAEMQRKAEAARAVRDQHSGPIAQSREKYLQITKRLAELRREIRFIDVRALPASVGQVPAMDSIKRVEFELNGANSRAVSLPSIQVVDSVDYQDNVDISFIVQYFRHPDNIDGIVDNLYTYPSKNPLGITGELLVNVDNPEEHAKWIAAMQRTGNFVTPVFSHNIHEIRGYNRLGAFANGEILDDGIPPGDCGWINNLIKLYRQWPRMGAVGLNIAMFGDCSQSAWWRLTNNVHDVFFNDPQIDVQHQFVSVIDLAPMTVRRSVYRELGGFDAFLSMPGEPGIFLDFDLAIRIWNAGYYVSHMAMNRGLGAGVGAGGTHFGKGLMHRQIQEGFNSNYYGRRHNDQSKIAIYEAVKKLNKLLVPVDPKNPEPWEEFLRIDRERRAGH